MRSEMLEHDFVAGQRIDKPSRRERRYDEERNTDQHCSFARIHKLLSKH